MCPLYVHILAPSGANWCQLVPKKGEAVTRWELCRVSVGISTAFVEFYTEGDMKQINGWPSIRRYLAVLSADGWELATVFLEDDQQVYLFKRPLSIIEEAEA